MTRPASVSFHLSLPEEDDSAANNYVERKKGKEHERGRLKQKEGRSVRRTEGMQDSI